MMVMMMVMMMVVMMVVMTMVMTMVMASEGLGLGLDRQYEMCVYNDQNRFLFLFLESAIISHA